MERHDETDGHLQLSPMRLPAGLTVEDSGRQLTIVRRWFTPDYLIMAFMCVGWDSALLLWLFLLSQAHAPLPLLVFIGMFFAAHFAVGIGLTYLTAAGLFNQTAVRVDAETLSVRNGPLPWIGNRSLAVADVEQLYTHIERKEGRRGVRFTYHLCAVTRERKKIKLISRLSEIDQSRFIEQRVNSFLGI
jgi:hypothetical protein